MVPSGDAARAADKTRHCSRRSAEQTGGGVGGWKGTFLARGGSPRRTQSFMARPLHVASQAGHQAETPPLAASV